MKLDNAIRGHTLRIAIGITALATLLFILPGLASAEASVGFREDFSSPVLDSSWQVLSGLGSYSLTDNPGYLRYYFKGPRSHGEGWKGQDCSGGWCPSLSSIRPFDGDNWILRTKVTYNINYYGTGAQVQKLYIALGRGINDYLVIERGTDQWYGYNDMGVTLVNNKTYLVNKIKLVAPDDTIKNGWAIHTYWYEVARNGQQITLRYSYDGINYIDVFSTVLTTPVEATQRVVISSTVWTTAGSYADWDYFYVEPMDTVSPTTTDNSPLNWMNADFTILLSCTDNPGGSGCKETKYRIDSGAWQTGNSISISTEGDHLIEYYSTDNAGNQESTRSAHARLDKTPPVITISGVADGSYYNSDVAPVIIITEANPNIQSITLNGAPYTSGTAIPAEGSYTLAASATDIAGNTASKTVRFTIDKTPPEAAIRFEAISKDIKVFNNEIGGEADYIVLPSVDEDDAEESQEDSEQGWELRQYTLKDTAANSLVLILNHKKEGKEAKVKIISTQYNNDVAVAAAKNRVQAEYSEDNGALKQLEQGTTVKKKFDAEAKYSAKIGQTEIKVKNEGQKEQKETLSGMVLLELLTDKGGLKLRY